MIDRISTYGPPILNAADALRRNYTSVTQSSNMGPGPFMNQEYGMMGSLPGSIPGNQFRSVNRNVTRSVSVPQRSIVSTQTINGVPMGSTITPMPPGVPGNFMPEVGPVRGSIVDTNFQRSIINGGPIDTMSIREDRMINGMNRVSNIYGDQLKRENDALRAEVQNMQKIEAGWFPGSPDEETRVTIVNNYQNQINANLEEISNLRLNIQQIEAENQQLRDQLLTAHSNPMFEQRIEELQRLNSKLTSDLNLARSSSNTSVVNVDRNYTTQIESLRSAKLELERELRNAQSQLAQKHEESSRLVLDERQKLTSLLEGERMNVQRLKDEVSRLQRDMTRVKSQPAALSNLPDPRQSEQLRSLQENLSRVEAERDRLSSLVIQLEAKTSAGPLVERVYDDAGVKERERLIEHYKAKWDELNAEKNQFKSQMAILQEENQKLRFRIESESGNSSSIALVVRKEKEVQDILRQQLEAAKEDANHYKIESQRLRDQLRSMASQVNKTEIHREVIVDRTGNFANSIRNNPSEAVNPRYLPGETEVVSRSVLRDNNASTWKTGGTVSTSTSTSVGPSTTYRGVQESTYNLQRTNTPSF